MNSIATVALVANEMDEQINFILIKLSINYYGNWINHKIKESRIPTRTSRNIRDLWIQFRCKEYIILIVKSKSKNRVVIIFIYIKLGYC